MLTLLAVQGIKKNNHPKSVQDLGAVFPNKSQNTHFILGGGWLYNGGWLSPKPFRFVKRRKGALAKTPFILDVL